MMLSVGAATGLFAMNAHAQNSQTSAFSASAAETPAPAPRYADSKLKRAFNYMDDNSDGKVSRKEASGFRGVARHFDQADTDLDGFLSRKEFDTAMNHVKSK